ncbi:MAG: FMN-dependent NADH-azoreductase [Flavobacteriaceae bacterium]
MNVLRIDSSVRLENSKSRQLTDFFLKVLKKQDHHSLKIRDVGMTPPTFPTDSFIKANYTPAENRTPEMEQLLKPSDILIDELSWADKIVIASPMYNFSISTPLKAYVDSIVRIGRTFYMDESGQMGGLLKDKKLLVITSRGAMSYQKGGTLEHLDHQEGYLRTVFQFMGITNITFVHAEAQDFGADELKVHNLHVAKQQLSQLSRVW